MSATSLPSLDARLYRAALQLYPEEFRTAYLDQIACDFDDARADAAASGHRRDLWMFRLLILRDFVRSLGTQWLRSGWPAIATAAVGVTWLQFTAVASFWWDSLLPMGSMDWNSNVVLLFMLLAVVFVACAATISTTIWIGRALCRPRRR
jgi:hypothetical protein